jgi:hypothetical protein
MECGYTINPKPEERPTDPWDQFEIDPEGFKQIDFSQRLVSPRPEIPRILYSPPLLPHPELNPDGSVKNKSCKRALKTRVARGILIEHPRRAKMEPKPLKVVNITALFPQLKGANCYQNGHGKGSTIKAATSRAFADMFKRMKGRKTFTECTVNMLFGTEATATPEEGQ